MNSMLLGSMTPDSQRLWLDICRPAPVKFFENPGLFFSTPAEEILPDVPDGLTVKLTPWFFRNVYNPVTHLSPLSIGTRTLFDRSKVVSKPDVQFIPYWDAIPVGMQNSATRRWTHGIMSVLPRYEFEFELNRIYPSDPAHAFAYTMFNGLAAEQFRSGGLF